jgi:hypothetical protein
MVLISGSELFERLVGQCRAFPRGWEDSGTAEKVEYSDVVLTPLWYVQLMTS